MNSGTKIKLLAIIFVIGATSACSRTDRIIKVAELPNTPDFEVNARQQIDPWAKPEKVHLDVGYLWTQNKFLFFPILNTDGRFVGYTGSDYQYIEFSKGELEDLTTKANIPMPQPPSIPFWDAWGGKLLLAVLIPPFVVLSLLLERLWRKISTGM
ncbi:MAG TPA: hypothetical protein VEV84_15455 [Pyrinomonadaceae bacterium]|jgi:hypothetical protein|nr:hypothetical protein [Pyrinomonadaceae bacterium]